jgi:hypothetical protein
MDEQFALAPDTETVDYRDVEVGRTYGIVMSQANGLYRYDLGDRYRVVDWVGEVPRLEFVGRTGFGSSFTGEKLTEEDIYRAVRGVLGDDWPTRPMFTCVPVWAAPPGYRLVIEWPESAPMAADRFIDLVEDELRRLNIEYAEKRRAHRLTPLAVLPVKPGTFGLIEDRRRLEGASPAQVKHHWIQRDDSFLKYFAMPGVNTDVDR